MFTFVPSSLKDKMHFMCRTRRLANASGQIGNLHHCALGKLNSMGSWCKKLSDYMGGWCRRILNTMGGWLKTKVPPPRYFFLE